MEELTIALWRARELDSAACHQVLLEGWSTIAQAVPGYQALTINIADIDQGMFRDGPDALIVLSLKSAHGLDDVPDRDVLHRIASRYEVWRTLSNEVLRDPTPGLGIKMVSLVHRGEQISHAQFIRHWNENHAPLALRHHVGMCGYMQREVRKAYTPGGSAVDGVAELSFRTRRDFDERLYDSDAGKAIIWDDVPRFIERKRGTGSLMTAHLF